jgi:hypothetical protein
VLDPVKLRRLKQAATDGDWLASSDIALELSLESKGTPDEFFVEERQLAVRLKDAERLAVTIDELNRVALD